MRTQRCVKDENQLSTLCDSLIVAMTSYAVIGASRGLGLEFIRQLVRRTVRY